MYEFKLILSLWYIVVVWQLTLDTPALNLRSSLETLFSCGTLQSQTGAVKVVMVLSTKQTPSLTQSTMRTNVRQLRLQSVGSYQASDHKKYFRLPLTYAMKKAKRAWQAWDRRSALINLWSQEQRNIATPWAPDRAKNYHLKTSNHLSFRSW